MTVKLMLGATLLMLQASPTPPVATGSIEGIVLDDTGSPVPGADIRAFWSPAPTIFQPDSVPRTVTTGNGRFVLSNLTPGGYQVSVRANGFAPQTYRQESALDAAVLMIKAGATIDSIQIRLVRSSSITGRVTSSSGEPLVGIEVHALRPAYDSYGSKYLAISATPGRTNDRGEYRISELGPGRYYVGAASDPILSNPNRDNSRIAATLGRSAVSPGLYQTAYYPREKDWRGATLLDVDSGSEVSGVNFALVRLQTYRIRGRVVDSATGNPPCPSRAPAPPGAAAPPCVFMGIRPLHADFISGLTQSSTAYQSDGNFELAGIASGTYVVTAQLPGTPLTLEQRRMLETPSGEAPQLPTPPRGVAVVEVRDADVDAVQLTIVRDLSLSGQVTIENLPPRELRGGETMKVGLAPVSAGQSGRPVLTTPDPRGAFRYSNLIPSEYRLKVEGLPDDVFVESAHRGSMDAFSEPIALFAPNPDPLNIALNPRGGRVQGRIVDSMGNALAKRTAVLIPNVGRTKSILYKTATTDASGQFVMRGVAPGDYKVFAWDEIEPNQFFDSEFVRKFEEDGVPVRVIGLSTTTVEARIVFTKSRVQ